MSEPGAPPEIEPGNVGVMHACGSTDVWIGGNCPVCGYSTLSECRGCGDVYVHNCLCVEREDES